VYDLVKIHVVVIVLHGVDNLNVSVRSFERRIGSLRRFFGPAWDRGEWRIRCNAELGELSKAHDTVRFVKTQRIGWLGHVERMLEERMPKRMLKGRLFSRRSKGRPRARWLDNVVTDLVVMGLEAGEEGWRAELAGGGL
jgi:hypothetical protein